MKRSKWRQRLPHGLCDPVLRSWLTEPDSLTARCQRASSSFRVRLLRFAKGAALADEAVEGGVGRERAWVREVALECDGVPVIFAHTTLAATGNGRLTRWMSRLEAVRSVPCCSPIPVSGAVPSSSCGWTAATRSSSARQNYRPLPANFGRGVPCTAWVRSRCW